MFNKTNILSILFLILSFVFNIREVSALDYFTDDFSDTTLSNWSLLKNSGGTNSFSIRDGVLVGEVFYEQGSFLIAKSFENLTDYSMEFDSLNESGVDQNIIFRASSDLNKYYVVNIRYRDPFWPDGGEIVLWKYDYGYKKLFTYSDNLGLLIKKEFHKIKIDVNNYNIKLFFGSNLIINFDDIDNPILSGSFGFNNWGGSYSNSSTKNLFDNLVVTYLKNEEISKNPKIIIIPGLGASWNSEAIVYNSDVDNDQWKMTPFVKNYNGLIEALKQNSLEENKDFYVWNYDWRKPLQNIVSDLNNFINQKINSDEKVILIGHSLGGLTARIWAEDNKDDVRLKKTITLGSPHLGSVDTYEIWNGGQISNLKSISSIAFKILLKIQSFGVKSEKDVARNYAPILKDLLPTFNFVSKNGVDFTNQLETKNNYLTNKNNAGIDSNINLKLFVGNDIKTTNSISLKNNNIFDRVLGIWPDGRINNFTYTNEGDGTVLVKSANYDKNDFVELNSDHGEIVDKTIDQIMTEIGLSQVEIVDENEDLENTLVFFIGSPVNYSVQCDNESPVLENDGFVVIKNNNYRMCNINYAGNGNGLIHIVAGNTDNNDWSYWEKNVVNGEIGSVKVNPKDGEIINDKNNILFLKSIIREDINSLLILNKDNKDLKEALRFLDKNQPKQLIRSIFNFRRMINERVVSQKIIDNTTIWLSLIDKCPKNRAISGYKIVNNYQNLIDKLINLKYKKSLKINENGAISYQKMDELIETIKNDLNSKDYTNVCANNFTALNYGNEVLWRSHGDESKKWSLQDSNL